MSGIFIDDVYVSFKHNIILEADTIASTSIPFEVKDTTSYTLTCSTLGALEEITFDVYDFSTDLWQLLYVDGTQVKFSQYNEQIYIKDSSMLLRLTKDATASAVGVTISYSKGDPL